VPDERTSSRDDRADLIERQQDEITRLRDDLARTEQRRRDLERERDRLKRQNERLKQQLDAARRGRVPPSGAVRERPCSRAWWTPGAARRRGVWPPRATATAATHR